MHALQYYGGGLHPVRRQIAHRVHPLRSSEIMRRRTKVVFGALVALAVLVGIAIAGGCSSSMLPPKVLAAQLTTIRQAHVAATVGVEPYKYPVYSESLIKDLRATGIFDAVDATGIVEHPRLLAAVDRPVHGTATVPVITIITLGIVPTTVEEEFGYVFTLRSSDSRKSVQIDYTYRGNTTLGWWALFLNLSPDRTSGDPTQTSRFRDNLAAAVNARRDSILQLAVER
jgi:hypothetical protein